MPAPGRPLATSPSPADYGTDWSHVQQRPIDPLEPTTRGPGDEVADGSAPTASSALRKPPAVPVWVDRMRDDGLASTEAGSAAARRPGSQRFIKRWKDAAGGY